MLLGRQNEPRHMLLVRQNWAVLVLELAAMYIALF